VQNALIIRIRYRLPGSTSIISKVVFVVVPVFSSYKKLSILYTNKIKIDVWYMKDTTHIIYNTYNTNTHI
jgi:hypothetical protein